MVSPKESASTEEDIESLNVHETERRRSSCKHVSFPAEPASLLSIPEESDLGCQERAPFQKAERRIRHVAPLSKQNFDFTPSCATPGGDWSVGDKVQVRDEETTKWFDGVVTALNPVRVRLVGSQDSFTWKMIQERGHLPEGDTQGEQERFEEARQRRMAHSEARRAGFQSLSRRRAEREDAAIAKRQEAIRASKPPRPRSGERSQQIAQSADHLSQSPRHVREGATSQLRRILRKTGFSEEPSNEENARRKQVIERAEAILAEDPATVHAMEGKASNESGDLEGEPRRALSSPNVGSCQMGQELEMDSSDVQVTSGRSSSNPCQAGAQAGTPVSDVVPEFPETILTHAPTAKEEEAVLKEAAESSPQFEANSNVMQTFIGRLSGQDSEPLEMVARTAAAENEPAIEERSGDHEMQNVLEIAHSKEGCSAVEPQGNMVVSSDFEATQDSPAQALESAESKATLAVVDMPVSARSPEDVDAALNGEPAINEAEARIAQTLSNAAIESAQLEVANRSENLQTLEPAVESLDREAASASMAEQSGHKSPRDDTEQRCQEANFAVAPERTLMPDRASAEKLEEGQKLSQLESDSSSSTSVGLRPETEVKGGAAKAQAPPFSAAKFLEVLKRLGLEPAEALDGLSLEELRRLASDLGMSNWHANGRKDLQQGLLVRLWSERTRGKVLSKAKKQALTKLCKSPRPPAQDPAQLLELLNRLTELEIMEEGPLTMMRLREVFAGLSVGFEALHALPQDEIRRLATRLHLTGLKANGLVQRLQASIWVDKAVRRSPNGHQLEYLEKLTVMRSLKTEHLPSESDLDGECQEHSIETQGDGEVEPEDLSGVDRSELQLAELDFDCCISKMPVSLTQARHRTMHV